MTTGFSIIISSYNYQNYISDAIQSIINQTYGNWELIIIDDGSTDNSVEIIQSFCNKDSRIKLYQHANHENKGLVETLKLGISLANSEWIVFLESDDILTQDYLEKKLEIIKNNKNAEFIFNKVELFGDNPAITELGYIMNKQDKIIQDRKIFTLQDLKNINIILTFSCVMIKKSLLDKIDYNTPVMPWLDYYLWLQIAQRTDLFYINEPLTKWRIHKNSYNKTPIDKKQTLDFEFAKLRFTNQKLPEFLLHILFIPKYIKYYRRNILRISIKNKTIVLFGKNIMKNSQ